MGNEESEEEEKKEKPKTTSQPLNEEAEKKLQEVELKVGELKKELQAAKD